MTTRSESPCRVCEHRSSFAFQQKVLGRDVAYFDCAHCGYVQTQKPFWLEEAYVEAIDELDTGIMSRNLLNSLRVLLTLAAFRQFDGRVLDHAGGHGILVRLLRDSGIEAHWDDKYCQNILARGFEADQHPYDLVTAFEVFEHLERPLEELESMLVRAPQALISTELIASIETPPRDWWYYGPEHGQHIGFFRRKTLGHIAERLGVHFATDGSSLHLFSRTPIPRGWTMLQRRPKLSRFVFARRLPSKIWSDFESIRARRLSSPR